MQVALVNELNTGVVHRAHRMGASVFDHTVMQILDTSPWLGAVKAHAKRACIKVADDLFLYKHDQGNWVLAIWVERPTGRYGMMTPMLGFESCPDDEGVKMPPVSDLIATLQPDCAKVRKWIRDQKSKENDRLRQREQEADLRQELGSFIKRRVDERLGNEILKGRKPMALSQTE